MYLNNSQEFLAGLIHSWTQNPQNPIQEFLTFKNTMDEAQHDLPQLQQWQAHELPQ